ncbi:4'-phosphopantetheinyl transferase superfamily protein [Ancylobacter sonchi]|uniref:4'-phosphopantetheinyl transferase family protein n=1 Tax=Ancylobacter sonchi TaxID=1937790 RepID=UPI001BD3365C|nr:4'-phosphopantetheinyl transferase superfamily protein [Ancylobacter sonchi]MBS7536699.1 4'-phosphopantetheinyl transferase superfamily protein [Ancylobacter sonchi]
MNSQITVWIFELDRTAGDLTAFNSWLSGDEAQRCARLLRTQDRDRFTTAHGIMRHILGKMTGERPETLAFVRNAHGKPSLERHESLEFNLSHSDGLGVLAVANGFPVGIDVEKIAPVEFALAEVALSPSECAELASCGQHESPTHFYRCWTRKEAVIKVLGLGLAQPPDIYDITPEFSREPRLLRLAGRSETSAIWELFHFIPAAGYMGALAAYGRGHSLVLNRWTPSAV